MLKVFTCEVCGYTFMKDTTGDIPTRTSYPCIHCGSKSSESKKGDNLSARSAERSTITTPKI